MQELKKDRFEIVCRDRQGINSLESQDEPEYFSTTSGHFAKIIHAREWIKKNGLVNKIYKIQNNLRRNDKEKEEKYEKWSWNSNKKEWKITTFEWGPKQPYYFKCVFCTGSNSKSCCHIKNYTPEMIDKKRQKQEKEKTNNWLTRKYVNE